MKVLKEEGAFRGVRIPHTESSYVKVHYGFSLSQKRNVVMLNEIQLLRLISNNQGICLYKRKP